jgi:hypothetical protein
VYPTLTSLSKDGNYPIVAKSAERVNSLRRRWKQEEGRGLK